MHPRNITVWIQTDKQINILPSVQQKYSAIVQQQQHSIMRENSLGGRAENMFLVAELRTWTFRC